MKRSLSRKPASLAPARFRSLLVPIDLTPSSDRILGRLSLLPLADDARLTVLHVIPRSLTPTEQRNAWRDVSKALMGEVRHLRRSLPKNVSVDPLVRLGSTAKEIGACATKVKAELIVMGRRSGRALRDFFLGSTAERVIRSARLPVLAVRLPPRAAYMRPALALHLDQAAHEVVRVMLLVLPTPVPRVAVIHAFQDPYRALTYSGLSDDDAEEREEKLRHKTTEELETLLATALAKANVRPEDAPPLTTYVRYGSPRFVVERAVRKTETDLLVLGTRGYSGAALAFLGTVAGDLLRAVTCDVLVVPPLVPAGE